MHIFEPLVKDSTASNFSGTGAVITQGAAAGYQAITAVGAVGDTFGYMIRKEGNAQWEEGLGTRTANGFTRSPLKGSSGAATLVNFVAGQYDVTHGLTTTLAKKFHSGTSARVVYLSDYCISDTDLTMYAPVAGVDQRAAIQAVLDLAVSGPLIVVCDIKATVANTPDSTGNALRLRSYTTLNVLPGCGFLQAAGSTGQLIGNYNMTIDPNAIVDTDITITGGIYHGNVTNQTGKPAIWQFIGVQNLVTNNYKLLRGAGMARRVANYKNDRNENYLVDFGAGNTTVNTDGVHWNGPGSGNRDYNGTVLNAGDDSMAFNADDAWGAGSFTGPYDNVYGPITDYIVENFTFRAAVFGIRQLSAGSRMDDGLFRNIKGSTAGYGYLMDNYLTPSQAVSPGPGNFGSITVDGWHVKNTVHSSNAAWMQMCMHISAKVEQLTLNNITKSAFVNELFPQIRIGEKANIDQLTINGYKSRNYSTGTYLADQIVFASGAVVGVAKINGADFYAPNQTGGCPINVNAGATINRLQLNGCSGNGFSDFVQNDGTVTNLHVPATNNFMDGAGAASTWFLEAGYTEVNAGAVTYAGPRLTANAARKVANDPFSAQIKLSSQIRFTGTATTSLVAGLFVRAVNPTPYSANGRVDYAFEIDKIAGTVKLGFRSANSSEDVIPTGCFVTVTGGLALNAFYTGSITAKDSVITATLQRVSDSFWLQPNGTWAATVANCCGGSNSSLGAGGGLQYGVYAIANNSDASVSGVEFSNVTPAAAP